jgi:hypothetical protein
VKIVVSTSRSARRTLASTTATAGPPILIESAGMTWRTFSSGSRC